MALDWLPIYPDRTPRRDGPKAKAPFITVENLSPLPNAPPPTNFTSYFFYPARLNPRPRNPDLRSQVVEPILTLSVLSPEVSLAIYPNRLNHPVYHPGPSGLYPFGVMEAIAALQAWKPSYPDHVFHSRMPNGGQSRYLVDASILLNAAGCLNWTQLQLTRPTFAAEALTLPDLLDETLTLPDLINEEMCDGVLQQRNQFLALLSGMNMQWLPTYPQPRQPARSRAPYTESFRRRLLP